ncbi:hypothetical protein QBC37DRAFT_60454 [Rhypophila decipiens]|uniref:DUF7735 domain-containing protein n=1 Tax=Rhypophila decipiens TaxID=261697 RepID=A0AAN6Y073_9PEZI|nr:hypothetical protein QBC37DRAFT_60454 [Rhypophila decipiens]
MAPSISILAALFLFSATSALAATVPSPVSSSSPTKASSSQNYFSILFPTVSPSYDRSDFYTCYLESIPQYFAAPTPDPMLRSQISPYIASLFDADPCYKTANPYDVFACPYPPKSKWCALLATTSTSAVTIPASIRPAFSAYASSCASWWGKHSSRAVELATECPQVWWSSMNKNITLPGRLNSTINIGECFAEQVGSISSSSTLQKPTQTPTPGVAAPGGAVTTETKPARTNAPNGIEGRMEGLGMWMVAGAGLAAGAANLN